MAHLRNIPKEAPHDVGFMHRLKQAQVDRHAMLERAQKQVGELTEDLEPTPKEVPSFLGEPVNKYKNAGKLEDLYTNVLSLMSQWREEDYYYKTSRQIRHARGESLKTVVHYTSTASVSTDNLEERLGEELGKLGIKILGSGHYSCVIECPWDETKAIKLGMGSGWECSEDYWYDGWLSWAAFCINYQQQHGNVEFLPNIYHMSFKDDMFLAVMDRYENTYYSLDVRESHSPYTQEILDKARAIMHCDYPNYARAKYEHLARQVSAIQQHPQCPKFYDLHKHNLMFIGNTVVITDPSSSDGTYRETKMQLFEQLGFKEPHNATGI